MKTMVEYQAVYERALREMKPYAPRIGLDADLMDYNWKHVIFDCFDMAQVFLDKYKDVLVINQDGDEKITVLYIWRGKEVGVIVNEISARLRALGYDPFA